MDPDRETVLEFIRRRQQKDPAGALAMITPNATLGTVWGHHHGTEAIAQFLTDEANFARRSYLKDYEVTKCDDGTYQRKFYYNRGMTDFRGNTWSPFPSFREIYFVKDGKIRCVVCFRHGTT